MNLSAATLFRVNYPEPAEQRRMQAACLGRSDITRTLNSAAESFSKNCSEPCRTSAAKARAYLSHAGAMWRAGLASRPFDPQRRLNRRHEHVWVTAGDELYHNTKAPFTRATVVSCWSMPRLTQEGMTLPEKPERARRV